MSGDILISLIGSTLPDASTNVCQLNPWIELDIEKIDYVGTVVGNPFHRVEPGIAGPDVVWQTRQVQMAEASWAGGRECFPTPSRLGIEIGDHPIISLAAFWLAHGEVDALDLVMPQTVLSHGSSVVKLVDVDAMTRARGGDPNAKIPRGPGISGGFFTKAF